MKQTPTIVKVRAYNIISEISFAHKITIKKIEKLIAYQFGENGVWVSIKCDNEIIENEGFSQFEVVCDKSKKLWKK